MFLIDVTTDKFYLLLTEEELEIVDLLSEVSNLIHVAVKASALLELAADLVVAEVSVAALSHMDLVGCALVVSVLTLEVIELLSQLSDECVLLAGLNADGFVATSLKERLGNPVG